MPKIRFAVDSALLRELGERLVGQPHVALAELIKNSYDADATAVQIRIHPNSMEISDNGQGMNLSEFRRFWMRIGSPHKGLQGTSRRLERPLTGQKGIGRLAAQFLGTDLEVVTASDRGGPQLTATVDWAKAVRAGDLTEAEADYKQSRRATSFPDDKKHGTRLIIRKLHHRWSDDDFKGLAREIWSLQPPFGESATPGAENTFRIELYGRDESRVEDFDEKLSPYLHLWHARIVGHVLAPKQRTASKTAEITVEFADGDRHSLPFSLDPCPLDRATFEVRVYSLHGRQGPTVKVEDLRHWGCLGLVIDPYSSAKSMRMLRPY